MKKARREKAAAATSSPPASPAGEMPKPKDSLSLKSGNPAGGWDDRWRVAGVCIFLAAIIWVVFGQTLGHEFVNYDDDLYVYDNPAVAHGFNLKVVEWAFTHIVGSNWHPLTMLSHMLDCQLYGLKAGGHHLTNVLLHTATAILLFLVLRRMMGLRPAKSVGAATLPAGVLWRSAFVAAVFAIHPLRVESVAWVSERKDVLSGLFFMLTLWAYTRYAQRRSRVESRETSAGTSRLALDPRLWTPDYFLVLFFFALGLMCKPMLASLPLILLLLDFWPLKRFTIQDSRNTPTLHDSTTPPLRLLLEKLPLFGLAVASCVVTIFAQTKAIQPFEKFPLPLRMGNALISCVAYIGQMFWPSDLAVLYPLTAGDVGTSGVVLSLVLLAVISAGIFVLRRCRPYLLTGWLWYLIMLVPVIGIVQVGSQARADRYTYLPQIGLYLLVAWALADLCANWRHRRLMLGGGSAIILTALMICARTQTSYWRNSESLWNHTLACTSDNAFAHNNLGNALFLKGNVDEAITHFQKALQINPNNEEAHNNLGNALLLKGNVDEAIAHCQRALQIKPDYAEAQSNLGNALLLKGNVDEAITQYQQALQIKPHAAGVRINLGSALIQKGRVDEAIIQYQLALQITPDSAEACYYLGNALLQKGRAGEAITHYQMALQIKPDFVDVLNNLALLLATCPDAHLRDGVQAVKYAGRACELTHHGVATLVGTLAAAYAEAGRYDEAIAAGEKACALATAAGERELLEQNQKLLVLYRAHQPFHETAGKVVPAAH